MDGVRREVVVLNGTIGTTFAGALYHTPIVIFLHYNYPSMRPIVFLRPAAGMIVVDRNPFVRLPFEVVVDSLNMWNPVASTLLGVVIEMVECFSHAPPLQSGPPAPATPSPMTPAQPSVAGMPGRGPATGMTSGYPPYTAATAGGAYGRPPGQADATRGGGPAPAVLPPPATYAPGTRPGLGPGMGAGTPPAVPAPVPTDPLAAMRDTVLNARTQLLCNVLQQELRATGHNAEVMLQVCGMLENRQQRGQAVLADIQRDAVACDEYLASLNTAIDTVRADVEKLEALSITTAPPTPAVTPGGAATPGRATDAAGSPSPSPEGGDAAAATNSIPALEVYRPVTPLQQQLLECQADISATESLFFVLRTAMRDGLLSITDPAVEKHIRRLARAQMKARWLAARIHAQLSHHSRTGPSAGAAVSGAGATASSSSSSSVTFSTMSGSGSAYPSATATAGMGGVRR